MDFKSWRDREGAGVNFVARIDVWGMAGGLWGERTCCFEKSFFPCGSCSSSNKEIVPVIAQMASASSVVYVYVILTLLYIPIYVVSAGWIDPDTIMEDYTLLGLGDGKTYELVMSDEFNKDGRKFADGEDR